MKHLKTLVLVLSATAVIAGCDHNGGTGPMGPVTVSAEAKNLVATQTCPTSAPLDVDTVTLLDDTSMTDVDSVTPACAPQT